MQFVIKGSTAAVEPSRALSHHPGGFTPPNKLRVLSQQGLGEQQVEQIEIARMMRMTDETAEPPRHVVLIEDVTRGLGLAVADAERIQKAISGTNVEFTPKTQTQRLVLARGMLVDLLRSMKAVPSDARMEIAKRAIAWWRKEQDTELNRSRTVGSIRWSMKKAEHWVTISGARILVRDGKFQGKHGARIQAHLDKKKGAGAKPESKGDKKGKKKAKTTSAAEALTEGYKAGERARIGDVSTLAHTVKQQSQRDERARQAVSARWPGTKGAVRKSLAFVPPMQRKMSLEW